MATGEAQQILKAVTQAAQAAAEAAKALREANEQARANRSGFSEASKVVKCPAAFGNANSSEDQAQWLDFAFAFKQWLCYAEPGFENDLKHVEEHLERVVTFTSTEVGAASETRSKKLYAILSGLLLHRPLKMLKQVAESNGLEVWRQLTSVYTPKTKTRSLGILSALMSHPSFSRDKTLLEQVHGLERLADAYRKASGTAVADDLLLTTLVRCLPKQIQNHIQLTMTESSTFEEVKEKVVSFERLSSTWAKERVYSELGMVTSYSNDAGGPAPMEINYVSKGKSKGKGKNKGGQKGKSKEKGKSKDAIGKGKQHNGKGYADATSKGTGKGQTKSSDAANRCNYCGNYGHWKRDCRKFQADKAAGKVRQVEGADNGQAASSPGSASSAAHGSPSASSYRSSGNVNRVAFQNSSVIIEDLTEFSSMSGSGSLRMIQHACTEFDMTITDSDNAWTFPSSFSEPTDVQHLRMMSFEGEGSSEIILDSGADTSALPLAYSGIGEPCNEGHMHSFVDAQGGKLDIKETRLATVD